MQDIIGAGSRKRVGGDWGEKWRNSPEFQDVKETVRQLNEEAMANQHEVGISRPLPAPVVQLMLDRITRRKAPSTPRAPSSSSRRCYRGVSQFIIQRKPCS